MKRLILALGFLLHLLVSGFLLQALWNLTIPLHDITWSQAVCVRLVIGLFMVPEVLEGSDSEFRKYGRLLLRETAGAVAAFGFGWILYVLGG